MKNKRLKEQLEEANISYETENAFSEKIERSMKKGLEGSSKHLRR